MPKNERVERTLTPFVIRFRYLCIDNHYIWNYLFFPRTPTVFIKQVEILALWPTISAAPACTYFTDSAIIPFVAFHVLVKFRYLER